MSLNVLVVSFYFPPYNKVGGRRWAKHCKYLKKENVKFRVLAGNHEGVSPWDKDIKSYTSAITRVDIVKPKIPYHKRKLPSTIFQKIVWKSSLIFWEFKKNLLKGNYYDQSKSNEIVFYSKAKSIILNENINTVILSVGPFSYSSIIPLLKSDFPSIKFVIDYRDYWEDGFIWLNKKQSDYEIKAQDKVIKSVDLILCPNNEMKDFYSKSFKKKSYLLQHCIDTDDILDLPQFNHGNIIKLLYGGAFYDDIGENISLIKLFIDAISKSHAVEADFFVSVKGYEKEMEHKSIRRFDFVPSNEYFEKLVQSDFVMLILPPNRVNAMSSKFFELVAFRKPILYFGNSGDVSNFIVKYKLGFNITKENFVSQAKGILENVKTKKIPDLNYNINTHTFEYQTKGLIKELETLCHSQN